MSYPQGNSNSVEAAHKNRITRLCGHGCLMWILQNDAVALFSRFVELNLPCVEHAPNPIQTHPNWIAFEVRIPVLPSPPSRDADDIAVWHIVVKEVSQRVDKDKSRRLPPEAILRASRVRA